MPPSPSQGIKIHRRSPRDSHCHHCLLSMETIALFQQSVTHSTALQTQKSGRDTQRSTADRTKTYCALRRSSEEWATYWFHPPWFAHSGKIAISIQGQQSCFKSHLNRVRFLWLSGSVNENCRRQKHITSVLLYGDRVQTFGHCRWDIDCATGHSQKSIRVCVEKDQSPFKQMPWFTMNDNKESFVQRRKKHQNLTHRFHTEKTDDYSQRN